MARYLAIGEFLNVVNSRASMDPLWAEYLDLISDIPSPPPIFDIDMKLLLGWVSLTRQGEMNTDLSSLPGKMIIEGANKK